MPVPRAGGEDVLIDADLMWLGGLDAVSYDVYLGTTEMNLAFMGNQPNNIFTPDSWTNDQAYFWRIDSVREDGSVVTGDIWSFTINDHQPRALSSRVPVTGDRPTSVLLSGSHPDGSDIFYEIETQPSGGVLSGSFPNLVYTPDSSFSGDDHLVFTASDGSDTSDPAIIIFERVEGNDAPYFIVENFRVISVGAGDSLSDSIATWAAGGGGSDLDFEIVSGPAWLSLAPDGTLGGIPQEIDLGANFWTIRVTDDAGANATAALEIEVDLGDVHVLSFTDLNTSFDANTLNLAGSPDGLSVDGSSDGADLLYSVVYDGEDYDGDGLNDSLSFDVRVKGWRGSSAFLGIDGLGSTDAAEATVGTIPSFVSVSDSTFVVGDTRMDVDESLEFSFENLSFDMTNPELEGVVHFGEFTSARLEQTSNSGNSHRVVFGDGTGLLGWLFNTNQESGVFESGFGVLYASSDEGGGTRSTSWGVANVDFDLRIEVLRPATSTGYDRWISGHFGESVPDGDDSDKDGIHNLLEYILNGDPTAADTSILPEMIREDGNPMFRFHRRIESKQDTIQNFQFSQDLESWTDIDLNADPLPANVTTTAISQDVEEVTIELDVSEIGSGRFFGRLAVGLE